MLVWMMSVVANGYLLNYILGIIVNSTSEDYQLVLSFNHKWKFEAYVLQEGCPLDLNSPITVEFPLGILRKAYTKHQLSSIVRTYNAVSEQFYAKALPTL